MSRFKFRPLLRFMAAVLPLALVTTACSRPPEQTQLSQFFRAARARDNTTLAMMSAVELDPREQGTVESFDITSVSPETRRPLGLKALLEAEAKARADEAEFAARKMEYQNANLRAIEQVVKLEREPTAKMSAAQQAVKAAWDTWREESSTYTRAVSDARIAVTAGVGPAQASLAQPGQPPFEAATFEGDLVTKDVALTASMKSPQGEASTKNLTVSMARVAGTQNGVAREGRWIITRISGL